MCDIVWVFPLPRSDIRTQIRTTGRSRSQHFLAEMQFTNLGTCQPAPSLTISTVFSNSRSSHVVHHQLWPSPSRTGGGIRTGIPSPGVCISATFSLHCIKVAMPLRDLYLHGFCVPHLFLEKADRDKAARWPIPPDKLLSQTWTTNQNAQLNPRSAAPRGEERGQGDPHRYKGT